MIAAQGGFGGASWAPPLPICLDRGAEARVGLEGLGRGGFTGGGEAGRAGGGGEGSEAGKILEAHPLAGACACPPIRFHGPAPSSILSDQAM